MKLDTGQDIKFIPLPKTVAKKLRGTRLSELERKLVDVIIEQTFGYEAFRDGNESVRRTSKALSSRYLSLLTDIARSTVNYELKRLEKRNIVTIEDGWFKGQKTNHIGVNLEVRQWDQTTNRIPQKEYTKLHEQAKKLVKWWWEKCNPITSTPDCTIEQGKRRDRTDLVLCKPGSCRANISVIVKVSWGDTVNWNYLNIPDKSNTIFCMVNKPMTMMAVIEPRSIRDLIPEDGYYRVPREVDSQGQNRISIKMLVTESKLEITNTLSGGNLNN